MTRNGTRTQDVVSNRLGQIDERTDRPGEAGSSAAAARPTIASWAEVTG